MIREDDSIGRVVLGRYRVVLQLGRGGQGAVYLARGEGAAGFARPVVVKRILAPFARDREMLEQFAREARITSQLRHPSIVPVLDFARDSDSYVMVLEYVHGYDLRRWERFVHRTKSRFDPELIAYPLLRVLDALQYAHTLRGPDGSPRWVVHRDISPANVLIDVDGHVKLTDFGIARMADEELTADTTTVRLKGKVPYLAPEMFRGAPASMHTDLYACGVMLHELLIGRNEFHGATVVESMARISSHVPTRLDVARKDLPGALARAVAKALEKAPEDRYQSAAEFAHDIRAAFDLPDSELSARFREAVNRDFNDPRCAQATGSQSLAELDAAWRETQSRLSLSEHAQLSPDAAAAADEAPTLVELPSAADSAPQADLTVSPKTRAVTRSPGMIAVLAALLLALGLFARRELDPNQAPRFVFVDQQRNVAANPAAPAQPSEPEDTALASATAPELSAPDPRHELRTLSDAERLTRAFSRHRSELEACFRRFEGAVRQQSLVLIEFSVNSAGRVLKTHLIPEELEATAFAACVTKIARATRFGAQSKALSFRIPIRASSHEP